jgi:prophage regulatory protein
MEISILPTLQRRLLRLSDVEHIINMKRSWVYDEVAQGRFPKPLKIGRASRWDSVAIDEYLADLAARQAAEGAAADAQASV